VREKWGTRGVMALEIIADEEKTMSAQTEAREEAVGTDNTLSREARAETGTILLVEDEGFVREVTSEVLRGAGYRVLTAKNALEAVHEYEACRGAVELLLTDVILPGESGRALAARLRRANPELKVLLVTGYGEHMGLRADEKEECLAKPYSAKVLLGRVRERIDVAEDGGESKSGAQEHERSRTVNEMRSGPPAGSGSLHDLSRDLGQRNDAGEGA
jgi:CheY-like chemotaxis protein